MAIEIENPDGKPGEPHEGRSVIEIHVHGTGDEAAETITVTAGHSISVFLSEYRGRDGRPVLAVALTDADEDLDPSRTWSEHGIGHGHRVHGRRCHLVTVGVDYNGTKITAEFRPNKRVARVKEWAVKQFGIPPLDAGDLVLAYGNPLQPINADLHVGDLRLTECRVDLRLVRADYFNG